MTALILAWLSKNWKMVTAALVIGSIVIGLSMFYGSWKLRGSKIESLKVDIAAAEKRATNAEATLARVQQVSKEWQSAAMECSDRSREAAMDAARYKAELSLERARRDSERRARQEAEKRLADAITAVECEQAVEQLAEALK